MNKPRNCWLCWLRCLRLVVALSNGSPISIHNIFGRQLCIWHTDNTHYSDTGDWPIRHIYFNICIYIYVYISSPGSSVQSAVSAESTCAVRCTLICIIQNTHMFLFYYIFFFCRCYVLLADRRWQQRRVWARVCAQFGMATEWTTENSRRGKVRSAKKKQNVNSLAFSLRTPNISELFIIFK